MDIPIVRRNLDLVLATILAVAGLLAGLATGLEPVLRGVFSVPLLIALPGYALTAALIPDRQSLGRTERTVLGVGMSIVIVILVGLGLNQLAEGIDGTTVSISLAAISLACVVVGLVRRRNLPPVEPPADADGPETGDAPGAAAVRSLEKPNRYGPEFLALAVVLTVAAVFVGVLGTVRAPQTEFTQLWMLPSSDPNVVQVGISDQEGQPLQYRLEVETQGQVLRTPEIDLNGGQEVVQSIKLPPLSATTPQAVIARLYRLDQPAGSPPYRQTLIWRYPKAG